MRPSRSVWIPLAVTAAGLGVFLWWRVTSPLDPVAATTSPDTRTSAIPGPGGALHPSENPLGGAFERLERKPDSLQSLRELQAKLGAMTSSEAVAWIREFLKNGKDRPTGLPFVIGADHTMKQWPTFRTFLLDSLRGIDPAAASEVSREILTKPTTADEWALALRNIGLIDKSAEAHELLRGKAEALITNPGWQANPSVGYLNSFDVLVHTGATESTSLLSSLIQRKDRKDLAHAAFLTMDRLVQKDPADMLTRIASDSALRQGRPEMAAQQFARADVRDPAQREIVKSWLLDPSRTGTELQSFSGIYPNNNHFISNNLLTTEITQSGAELAAHDRAALKVLNAWSADPAFTPVKEHLASMIARLNGFVATPGKEKP